MHEALEVAIAEQYTAFRRPPPAQVEGCPCCARPEELRALVRTPLRELTHAQLANYARAALTTVGGVDEFRYFWPRLAELVVAVPPAEYFVDPEVLLGKPALAAWREWPRAEQQAVEQFASALIERMRDEPLDADEADAWVCAVGQILEDVTPLLDRGLLADTPPARHNLRGLYDWNRRDIEKRGTLGNAFFWEPAGAAAEHAVINPNVRKIVAWFGRADVSAAADRAYAEAALAQG